MRVRKHDFKTKLEMVRSKWRGGKCYCYVASREVISDKKKSYNNVVKVLAKDKRVAFVCVCFYAQDLRRCYRVRRRDDGDADLEKV